MNPQSMGFAGGVDHDEESAAPAGGMSASAEEGAASESAPQSWRRHTDQGSFAQVSLGGGQSLELRDVRVSVRVEGHRARTVVDHVFYNPHARTLEGTFRYSLPPEATVSGYAMFLGTGSEQPSFFGDDEDAMRRREAALQGGSVQSLTDSVDTRDWGQLRVGRFVRAQQGREVYENTTRRNVDPALAETVGPNSFEARVFPIQANAYHRVIISYEQTLPRLGDELEYLFPMPEGELSSLDFSLQADGQSVGSLRYTGDVRGESSGDFEHHVRVEGNTQPGALSYRFGVRAPGGVETLVGTDPVTNVSHFALRVSANDTLGGRASSASGDAVFLLDTSLSEHPDRFSIDVALLNGILRQNPNIRRFNVVTFDAGARWLSSEWLANSEQGRARAMSTIDDILLEGATDLSAALTALHAPPMNASDSVDVFLLSDGAITWGERDIATLVAPRNSPWGAMRTFAYRTGLGAENTDLLRRVAAEGVFNCLSMESVAGCSVAHTRHALRIESVSVEGVGGGADADSVLVAGGASTFAPGTELTVVGRVSRPGAARLRIRGHLAGRAMEWTRPVQLQPTGELASRAWAEVAVAHLLSGGDYSQEDRAREDLAVSIGQHYRVPSRVTSVLVLETDAEYEQYDLQTEFSQWNPESVPSAQARTSWSRLRRALEDGERHNHLARLEGGRILRELSGIVSQRPRSFVSNTRHVPLVLRSDVGRRYRRGITRDADSVEHFRDEAMRRHAQGDTGAAIRALSSSVENAPTSAEVARSLAYTLISWGENAAAAELLFSVLERRAYEPQSYRDLAGALWLYRPSMTALLFEAALAGERDARFRGVLTVVQEEYALFAQAFIRAQPNAPLARFLRERQQALALRVPEGDLRVTMTWNTDNTDVDLWVTDPSGEKCYYAHPRTAAGGHLLEDVTRGFGPERFQLSDAPSGEYHVQAHYYGNNGNRLVADTYVTLTVTRYVGTEQQQITRHVVRLVDAGENVSVARFRL